MCGIQSDEIIGPAAGPRSPAWRSDSPVGRALPFLDPSAADFFNPVLVTTPFVEIIGDRGVTAASLIRILRHADCWFDGSRSDRWLSAVHLSRSSRRFTVAHLACLFNVREADVAHLSSTTTMLQAGHQRRQASASIAMGISQHVAVS